MTFLLVLSHAAAAFVGFVLGFLAAMKIAGVIP
jgi:hypothetical protein